MRVRAYAAAACLAGGLLLSASIASAQAPESQVSPTPAPPSAESTQLPPVVVDAPAAKKVAVKKKSAKAKGAPQAKGPQATASAKQDSAQSESPLKSPANSFVATTSIASTKTDTPILETPQSISVITREQLDKRGVKTVVEALQYVPGIYTHPGGKDPRFDQYQIRGFDAQGYGAFRDGLKELGSAANFNHFRTEPYGLERIDVIRGPSSVLYGQIAPGGLVNSITKRPTKETMREVVGHIGTNDMYEGAFDLSGAVDPSAEFMFRLTGLVRDADAQVAHFADFVPDDRVFIAPSFTWRPDDNTTVTLLSDYQHDETGNAFPVSVATLGPGFTLPVRDANALPLYLGDPSFNKFEQDQFRIGYQFEHRFNETFTVRQGLRYGEVDLDYRYLTGNAIASGPSTFNRFAVAIDESTSSFTMDNQLQAKFSSGAVKHTFLTGLDYQAFELDAVTHRNLGPQLNINNPVYWQPVATPTTLFASTDQSADQTGVYLQDQAKLDGWLLTLGGRYDWAEVDTLNRLSKLRTKSNDEAFTGRAGLTYLFDFGLAPYASYSESFLPTTGTDFSGNPFDPTTGQQYEVGIKYEPLGTRSRLTLAAFDLTQQNVLTTDPVNAGFSVQTGEIRSRGLEAEASASLTDGLELIATYTLMDVEVTKSTQGNVGKTPIVTPEEMASIFADYTIQSGPFARLGFGAGARYIGESYKDLPNNYTNDAYTVFDAVAHYALTDGTLLQVNASNIFNNGDATCSTSGGCQYISPRIVTGKVSYRW